MTNADLHVGDADLAVPFNEALSVWCRVAALSFGGPAGQIAVMHRIPYVAAILASVLATWVTFVPCFLWIFLGAPYVERLRENRAIAASLSAITAAVVGVTLNLAAWFAVHVLFASVREERLYGVRWLIPELGTVRPVSLTLAVVAAVVLIRYKMGALPVLGAAAGFGIFYRLLSGGG
jgi:chromate transporter